MDLNRILSIPSLVDTASSYPHTSSRIALLHESIDTSSTHLIPHLDIVNNLLKKATEKTVDKRLSYEGMNKRPVGFIDHCLFGKIAGEFSKADPKEAISKNTDVAYRAALTTLFDANPKRAEGPLGNPVFTAQYLIPSAFLALSVDREKAAIIAYAALKTGTRAGMLGMLKGAVIAPFFLLGAPLVLYYAFKRTGFLTLFGLKRRNGKIVQRGKKYDPNRDLFKKAAQNYLDWNYEPIGLNCFQYVLAKQPSIQAQIDDNERYSDVAHFEDLETRVCAGEDTWKEICKMRRAAWRAAPRHLKAAMTAYWSMVRFSVPTPMGMLMESLMLGLAYSGRQLHLWQPYDMEMKQIALSRWKRAQVTHRLQEALLKKDIKNAKAYAEQDFDPGIKMYIPKDIIGQLGWLVEALERMVNKHPTPAYKEWMISTKKLISSEKASNET